jgi:predicted chitinase
MLSSSVLQAIMPALPAAKREALLPFLNAALAEFGIDSAPRHAAFIAQLAHESGQFRFMEELWGPTPAQVRYEPRTSLATSLGNTVPGDGKRFKGRGPIQITGRANYRRYGGLLGVDLESEPQLAARPELAFRIAALFWSSNGLNELADEATAEAFKKITRRINGGFNGLADRQQFYAVACATLGVAPGAAARARTRGTRSPITTGRRPRLERGAEAIARGRRRTVAKRKSPTSRARRTKR